MIEDLFISHDMNAALVALFGAEARDIHVPSLDHLCTTFTAARVEKLLRAVGGPWQELLDRTAARKATIGTSDPGLDPRFKDEKAQA